MDTFSSGVPDRVTLVEVGPRDGLQNEAKTLPIELRAFLIDNLAEAGLPFIECGSFVSPTWVPQMAGTDKVLAAIRRLPGITYTALVPNLKGLDKAAETKVDEVSVFVAASEAFSRANINCSIDESLRRAEEVLKAAIQLKMPVRGYVSCVLGCPFGERVENLEVARVSQALYQMGCREISLGDTIGVGTPGRAQKMLEAVGCVVPLKRLAVHYHDTWGQGLANILISLQVGIETVDCSVAGLGGCPYAPGASGNVATEDVVYMLNGLGVATGVDLGKVAAAGKAVCAALGRTPRSKAAIALEAAGQASL